MADLVYHCGNLVICYEPVYVSLAKAN